MHNYALPVYTYLWHMHIYFRPIQIQFSLI